MAIDPSKVNRLRVVLQEMQRMHVVATGEPNKHLHVILTAPALNQATIKRFAGDEFDSPRIKIFSSHAGDKVPDGDFAKFNRQYSALYSEAFCLVSELGLLHATDV